jgi:hypothetical protein
LRYDDRMRPLTLATACLAGCLWQGCEHRPVTPGPDSSAQTVPPLPPPPPPAPDAAAPREKAVVPKGCDINLAGRYHLARRPLWRYLVEDDGDQLVARPLDSGDGGGSEAMAMVLDRTGHGFVGTLSGSARAASGELCPVAFKAQIVACDGDGVTVRSDDAISLDGQCRMRRVEGQVTDKVLVRE